MLFNWLKLRVNYFIFPGLTFPGLNSVKTKLYLLYAPALIFSGSPVDSFRMGGSLQGPISPYVQSMAGSGCSCYVTACRQQCSLTVNMFLV